MSHASQSKNIVQMEAFLQKVKDYAFPKPGGNFFSIGGRGYYENPTSDLLAFFMRPDEQHGFGSKFLEVFFGCMKANQKRRMKFDFSTPIFDGEVMISREHPCDAGRMDFYITGPGWVLVIENKIHHWQSNPFRSYERYAKRYSKTPYLAILSPLGETQDGWEPVTYKEYCKAIKSAIPALISKPLTSKWHVFAREFIDHLEKELYMQLDDKQISFIENYLSSIPDMLKLVDTYNRFLVEEIQQGLLKEVPDEQYIILDKSWGFECRDATQERWVFHLLTPYKPDQNNLDRKFKIGVQAFNLTEQQRIRAKNGICEAMEYFLGDNEVDRWELTLQKREEAVSALCNAAKLLAEISKS